VVVMLVMIGTQQDEMTTALLNMHGTRDAENDSEILLFLSFESQTVLWFISVNLKKTPVVVIFNRLRSTYLGNGTYPSSDVCPWCLRLPSGP
jgi:hypothetical protein